MESTAEIADKPARAQGIHGRRRTWLGRGLAWAAWLYLFAIVVLWAVMRWAGDRWWLATLVLFGPRWPYLLPLAVLVPLALIFRRRSLGPLCAAALVAFGPLAGFCIPWAGLFMRGSPGIRVLSCNTKGRCCGNERLDALIRGSHPDIVALQGCWGEFRVEWPEDWHVLRRGELVIASRFPLRQVTVTRHSRTGFHELRENLLSCVVDLPQGELPLATLHLQSPHFGISRVLDRHTGIEPSRSGLIIAETQARWEESEEVLSQLAADGLPDLVVGDFNLPEESPIYRSYWAAWRDAFSAAGWGFGGTEWPRGKAGICFGIRIDHILFAPRWRAGCCWVGPDVGSDHLPLLADLCPQ